jgi:hypothetical protein
MAEARGQTVTAFYAAGDYAQPGKLDPAWITQIEQDLENKGNHPILLMHDGGSFRGNTVQALDAIIDWYARRGYVFTDPAGRPFPGDLPAGASVPPTGWAIPPGWTAPDNSTGVTAENGGTPGPGAGRPTGPTGGSTAGTPGSSPGGTTTTGGTSPGTGTPSAATGGATSGTAPATSPNWNRRMATLAAQSGQSPLAAQLLSEALTRYLMVFSAPPG